MSHFIYINSVLPLQSPMILKTLRSKVIQSKILSRQSFRMSQKRQSKNILFKSSLSGTNSPLKFNNHDQNDNLHLILKSKGQKRLYQQIKIANNLQEFFITGQYEMMKNKLQNYAKSPKHKIQKILSDQNKINMNYQNFQQIYKQLKQAQLQLSRKTPQVFPRSQSTSTIDKSRKRINNKDEKNQHKKSNIKTIKFNHTANLDKKMLEQFLKKQEQQKKAKLAAYKSLHKKKSEQHVVELDKKYNTQFTIKLATIIEAQNIKTFKQDLLQRKSNSQKNQSPLVVSINRINSCPRKSFNFNEQRQNSMFSPQSHQRKSSIADLGIRLADKKCKQYQPIKKSYKFFNKNQSKNYQQHKFKDILQEDPSIFVYKNIQKQNQIPLQNNLIKMQLSTQKNYDKKINNHERKSVSIHTNNLKNI